MKIFILEPIGQKSYLLFDTMVETFRKHDHEFIYTPDGADLCFFDLWNGFGDYPDTAKMVLKMDLPVVAFDFFDQWGSPKHSPGWWGWDDYKALREKAQQGQPWAVYLEAFVYHHQLKICFQRKMSNSWEYPNWVKPIECCLYPDHNFQPACEEELYRREFDICFIGNATPWRANLVCDLVKAGFKVDYFFPYHRMEHKDWLNRHRNARMFLEADGGGYGSERPYQLITIAPMVRLSNDQKLYAPWTSGENCVEVGGIYGNLKSETDEINMLHDVMESSDFLFSIYKKGMEHMHNHYSAEARSEYIISQLL